MKADDTVSDCNFCGKKNIFHGKTFFLSCPKYLLFKTERFSLNGG